MQKIRLFIIALLLLVTDMVYAQNIVVTGTVTDFSTGQPVAAATILLQGSTTQYTQSDDLGNYQIKVPPDGVLVFSLLGYETAEISVNGQIVINVALNLLTEALGDVIVVAYGTSTRSSFTGSAAMVNSKKIEKSVTSNLTTILTGVTPGVQVISTSGDPTIDGNIIRIRGIGSMSASSNPLIILDGMSYDGSLKDINSNDVESMSVLKDASASAIYGARGANGVILITTKKAAGNKLPDVKFDARWGSNSRLVPQYDIITNPAEYYETWYKLMFNSQYYAGKSIEESYDYANKNIFDENNGGLGYKVYTVPEGENLVGTNFKVNPHATLGYSDGTYYYTPDNWYDIAFHNSFRQEYNLSISGSTDKLSYFASAGYLDDGGMVNNSDYKRYTARVNASYQVKTWLKFVTNLGYSHSISKTPSYGIMWGSSGNLFYVCNNIGPIYPLYVRDADGNIVMKNGHNVYDFNQTNFKRPAIVGNAVRDNEYDKKLQYSDALNAKWGVVFTPVKGLDISGNVGLTDNNARYNALYSPFGGGSGSSDGIAAVSHDRYFGVTSQVLIEYKTDFEGSKHNFDILAGYERYIVKSQGLSGSNTHLFDPFVGELDNAGTVMEQVANSSTTNYMTEGFLGRVQYDYDRRYFISTSYRRDASSRFAKGHRWGNFGSVGLAWNIAAEPFMEGTDWIDLLKLKASWGVQGNDNIGGYFPYADMYSHSYNEESKEYSMILAQKGNENLTWESSHAFNVGIDFGFFNGRLNGSLEFFDRITTDMLYNKPTPLSSGNPTGFYPINVGSMSNIGYELTMDCSVIRTKNVDWNLNLNLTSYKNKILSLDKDIPEDGLKSGIDIIRIGGSIYNAYMRKYAGVDNETGEAMYYKKIMVDSEENLLDNIGNPVLDEDGNPMKKQIWKGDVETTKIFTEADQFELGTVLPKIFGGFGTTFTAYGFDLSLQFQFQLGGKYYDGSYQAMMMTQRNPGQNIHRDILKAWTPENSDSNYPRLDGNSIVGQTAVDRFLVSSNYLSLNNTQIGYTFPKKWMSKLQIDSLRVYLASENLFMFTARKGIDPRSTFGMGSYTSGSGLNTNGYGNMRNITGGISITF